jgi:hypothetical protein
MYYELIVLGIVCFLAPGLARLAGYETGRKGFDLVGVGGIFFLLTAAFMLGGNMVLMLGSAIGHLLSMVTFALGTLALLVGAVWEMVEVILEPEHGLLHKATGTRM